jgi:CRISPR-associated protein Csb2
MGECCISVTFLAGFYHGEEWPPSPARLYQAMVAAVMTCGYRIFEPAVEPALLWIERQPAPRIRCCGAEQTSSYRIAVPNNDMDVVAWEWKQGRHKDVAVLKTMKQITPWRLPESGPHVQYIWPQSEAAGAPPVPALTQASHLLHTLGWGVDMACADIGGERIAGELYEPANSGQKRLSTPIPGTLEDLKAAYARFQVRAIRKAVDSSTRPAMLGSQPYRRSGEEYRPVTFFRLMRPDREDVDRGFSTPWENCHAVAAWLRHGAAEELRRELPEEVIAGYVQGHIESPEADKSRRISYVPVPTISGPHPDGAIRRAMIVEPADETGEISQLIERKLTGAVLTKNGGDKACCLAPPETNDPVFRQYVPKQGRNVWRSVTPVILHGFNTGKHGEISVAKTERLLLRAFEMAGFREEQIAGFAFQTGPLWPGTKHSAAIRVPRHLNGYPRIHVEVRFRAPVLGPVLAGIGRHYGIGLFASASAS